MRGADSVVAVSMCATAPDPLRLIRDQPGPTPANQNEARTVNRPLAYSVNEACKVAGIGRTSLYGLIGSGELCAIKAGKRTLIRVDELRRWLDELPTIPPKRSAPGTTIPVAANTNWRKEAA
jgi:excisionase family DNA binding protein